MAAQLIDGKTHANSLLEGMAEEIREMKVKPGLASIIVGDDPNSAMYVDIKRRASEKIGMKFEKHPYPGNFDPALIVQQIHEINSDLSIHGILIQLPLPPQFKRVEILKSVHPFKDVDALHPKNLGLLMEGTPLFLSPVIRAVSEAIALTNKFGTTDFRTQKETITVPDLRGVSIALLGSGLLVGRPLAQFFSLLGSTVTIINEDTPDAGRYTSLADIVITGTNSTDVLQPDDVSDGTIVIDVGGDIVADKFLEKDIFLSMNPGGIGPLTVAYLLKNTLVASKNNM